MRLAKPSVADPRLKIGDVADLAELSIDAVRFYEREGLLGRVRRSPAGQREYDAESVRRLAFVRRATALGFSLAEVRDLLTLRVSARMPCERVRQRALAKLADIEQRIVELEAMRGALVRLATSCKEGDATGACPFLDELARPLRNSEPLVDGAERLHAERSSFSTLRDAPTSSPRALDNLSDRKSP